MGTLIHFNGQVVATVGATRFYLAPALEDRAPDDPERRFVAFMCAFALDVERGELPGPFSSERAELFARCALIADHEFHTLAPLPDVELAERFGVPLEQVALKRRDLTAPSAQRGRHGDRLRDRARTLRGL